MRKFRFTEEQIAFALRQAETGTKVSEVCRMYCESGLNLRSKRPGRRVSAACREKRPEVCNIDERW